MSEAVNVLVEYFFQKRKHQRGTVLAESAKNDDGLLLDLVILVVDQDVDMFKILGLDEEGVEALVQRLEHREANGFLGVGDDDGEEFF